jgi:hypothetical protein
MADDAAGAAEATEQLLTSMLRVDGPRPPQHPGALKNLAY